MLTPSRVPIATYRLQFNKSFTFPQALELVSYLRQLGITDLYASPIFQAGPESTHGYDICDFAVISPALGGEKSLYELSQALRKNEMGLLVDMVPNHMGNDQTNCWWRDVLRNGRKSPFANFFDINWDTPEPGLKDKVLLPVLGDHYNNVLERGELKVAAKEDELRLTYFDANFPLSDESIKELASAKNNPAFLKDFNGTSGNARSFDRLHALIEKQHYRLAFWRIGPEEINYRRFFDITQLVSLKMERQEVFQQAHEAVMNMVKKGDITGLRIDHPDGLWDPKSYFERLQESFSKAGSTKGLLYVVAEKILSEDETLPKEWPVHGTTGYDYLNKLNGIFVKPDSRETLSRFYGEFTGEKQEMYDILVSAKKKLLNTSFISEKRALTQRLKSLAASTRIGKDLAQTRLEMAIEELLAYFPIYRTYVDENSAKLSETDTKYLHHAFDTASSAIEELTKPALIFLHRILRLEYPDDFSAESKAESMTFAMKFQQLSGPLMAKGLEDTTFYRYFPFVSLNEVGGNPSEWGKTLEQFHSFNQLRAAHWPHSLSATATHDTKRGEDTRARMNVISELPEKWKELVLKWSKLNQAHKQNDSPTPNDEYLLYQTLAGVWPFQANEAELKSLTERVKAYMQKAVREAKVHTTWIDQNSKYEEGISNFIEQVLQPGSDFVASFSAFHKSIAYFGMFNSLSQTLLKIGSPGVPDFYQGCEFWDFSMVDPDNRQPVNYDIRKKLIQKLVDGSAPVPGELWKDWQTGLVKMFVVFHALEFRRKTADIFQGGSYESLRVSGTKADHVCMFARSLAGRSVIVAAPRFVYTLLSGAEKLPIGDVWANTVATLPNAKPAKFRNIFTGETVESTSNQSLKISDIFATFPLAILESV